MRQEQSWMTQHILPEFQKGAERAEGERAQWTQCGTCGRWWDDSLITSITPTPAGRCPFEYEHEEQDQ